MRPLCALICFIFFFFLTIVYTCIRYSSFLEMSSRYSLVNKKNVHIVNAELIESTLKQTIMCLF
jgi:hypothetical protein